MVCRRSLEVWKPRTATLSRTARVLPAIWRQECYTRRILSSVYLTSRVVFLTCRLLFVVLFMSSKFNLLLLFTQARCLHARTRCGARVRLPSPDSKRYLQTKTALTDSLIFRRPVQKRVKIFWKYVLIFKSYISTVLTLKHWFNVCTYDVTSATLRAHAWPLSLGTFESDRALFSLGLLVEY